MGKIILFIGALIYSFGVFGQNKRTEHNLGKHQFNGFLFSEEEFRESIAAVQVKYLHVRESFYIDAKGQKVYNNRGADVEDIQRRSGCPLGCFWCGAYMHVLFQDMGVDTRKDLGVEPLLVASWFGDPGKIVYRRNAGNPRGGVLPRKGDLLRMYASHVEMYVGDDWLKDLLIRKKIPSGGGNTGGGTGAHGVHITERRASDIQLAANWITPYFNKLKQNESTKSK